MPITDRHLSVLICSAISDSFGRHCARGKGLEIGSGSGYWASLLEKRGVDVIAVDNGSECPAPT